MRDGHMSRCADGVSRSAAIATVHTLVGEGLSYLPAQEVVILFLRSEKASNG
jgi:hypothetical protein